MAEETIRRIKQQPLACSRTLRGKSLHHGKARRADKLAIAFTTAQRAIERLERAKIVRRMGDAKCNRIYCATSLLHILEEPARLKPLDDK